MVHLDRHPNDDSDILKMALNDDDCLAAVQPQDDKNPLVDTWLVQWMDRMQAPSPSTPLRSLASSRRKAIVLL